MTKPVLSQETEYGRFYIHPLTGEAVPSVTNVIDKGIPKPKLVDWAARMAAQHAVRDWLRLSGLPLARRQDEIMNAHKVYTQQKADIGDVVHNIVDCWMSGQPHPEYPKEVNGHVNQLINFLAAVKPVFLENETTFWSRKHGYAGTGDFIIRVDGRNLLSDLKTGKNLHPEVGLQTSALAHADFMLRPDGTEEPLPHIDGLAALHIRPRSWKLVELNYPEECFSAFLSARSVMMWEKEIAPHVLG